MVDVLSQSLQKNTADSVGALRAVEDAERLSLAVTGAGVVAFSWTPSDDRIVWDGNIDILPNKFSGEGLNRGRAFLSFVAARDQVLDVGLYWYVCAPER